MFSKFTEIFQKFFLFCFVITVNHVFWIAVQMVYATTVRRRCDAVVPSVKVEINVKTVGRFKISFAFVILMN